MAREDKNEGTSTRGTAWENHAPQGLVQLVRKMRAQWEERTAAWAKIASRLLPSALTDPGVEAAAAQLARSFAELPGVLRNVNRELARRGWYLALDVTIPGVKALSSMIEQGREDDIAAALVSHVRSKAEDIQKKAVAAAPRRAGILTEAFAAHREGRYALSVPALLAQADGMFFDLLFNPEVFTDRKQISLFGKQKGKGVVRTKAGKALREHLQHASRDLDADGDMVQENVDIERVHPSLDDLHDAMLQAILEPGSFCADAPTSVQAGDPSFPRGAMSRHAVLHGRDVGYATEANSLRCILLIDYILDMSKVLEWHGEGLRILGEMRDCAGGS